MKGLGWRIGLAASVLAAAGSLARGAEVEMSLSTTETFVGVPFLVRITVTNAESSEPPEAPAIAGASVEYLGEGGRTQFMSNINGKVSQSVSITYQFRVTPEKPGTLLIPAVTVVADGTKHQTRARKVVVTKSDTGDLLFVELEGARPAVYVGQQLNVMLKILIKPFFDARLQFRMNRDHMWDRVDLNSSQWGVFREKLASMMARRERPPSREVIRNDSQGQPHAYYLYEIEATMTPQRPGKLNAEDLRVVVIYPTRLARTIFGDLTLEDSRPITASVQASQTQVKPLPAAGRPPHFTGAVGRYEITANAKPLDVAAGDPITLTLTIRGQGNLETLLPPSLPELEELSRDFRVPSDPLAGTVRGGAKRFVQTLRARDETVTRIPAIPFTYFDPDKEAYFTARTREIPLRVRPAAQLPVSQIVQAPNAANTPTQLTERSGGILPNETDLELLLAEQSFSPGMSTGMAAVMPPLAWLGCWLVQRRNRRLRNDVAYARRRAAPRNARAALDAASRAEASDIPGLVAAALRHYVADRCHLPSGGLTSDESVRQLAARGASEAAVRRWRELLDQCETAQYAAKAGVEPRGLVEAAERCVAELEAERFA